MSHPHWVLNFVVQYFIAITFESWIICLGLQILLLRISTAVKFFKFCWAAVVVGVSPICCFFVEPPGGCCWLWHGCCCFSCCQVLVVLLFSCCGWFLLLYDHGCGVSFFSISGSLLVGNSIDCGTLGQPWIKVYPAISCSLSSLKSVALNMESPSLCDLPF